jgi:hypothetical protein
MPDLPPLPLGADFTTDDWTAFLAESPINLAVAWFFAACANPSDEVVEASTSTFEALDADDTLPYLVQLITTSGAMIHTMTAHNPAPIGMLLADRDGNVLNVDELARNDRSGAAAVAAVRAVTAAANRIGGDETATPFDFIPRDPDAETIAEFSTAVFQVAGSTAAAFGRWNAARVARAN